ncbi:hypothetical protein Misp06_02177 [Microbulbifer sp. NBRC 101763]|uniref:PLDc N-terminal domain-containing protein n=2 Tax=Microbulbiferaceae TaxID=1706373 RepID=UPI0003760A02|nr:PLDc N-terminal domain-containing protein [Microbulbifer variabilis]
MPFLVLSILIQVAFVIHVLKTGRNTTWIWILVMLPLAGLIAYLILEILPEMNNSRNGQKARRKVQKLMNPNQDINQAAQNLAKSSSIKNYIKMAEECLEKGLNQEAKDLYQKSLQGPFKDDPQILFGLARCLFLLKEFNNCKETLDFLIDKSPEFKDQDAHLLYARTLDALQMIAEAEHEYETLYSYYSGPAAGLYYAIFLKRLQQGDKAMNILQRILKNADETNSFYRSIHKDILKQAKAELSG